MRELAPPIRPAAGAGGSGRIEPRRHSAERHADPVEDALVSAIDSLGRRIGAVWNETPEMLAMLADWSDALEAQRRELEDRPAPSGARPILAPRLRRVLRDAALDVALLGRLGRRLRQIERQGERLRAAQACAAARAPDAARRAMLERHLARTERHLGRLRERLHPGR